MAREGGGSMPRSGRALFEKSKKRRRAREWVSDALLRPLAHRLVLGLYRTPVQPEHLVLFQGLLGLVAAGLIAGGMGAWAAPLLLIKALLDNADGQLARARDQASQLGRYLDTEVDFLVNLALFWALGRATGAWALAAGAFILLTLLLSADYALNSEKTLPPRRGKEPWAGWLAAGYALIFGPQDRLFETVFRRWPPPGWLGPVLANLGLSTQHALLALFLLFGSPLGYLVVVVLTFLLVLFGYLLRVWRTPSPPSPPSPSGPRGGSSS